MQKYLSRETISWIGFGIIRLKIFSRIFFMSSFRGIFFSHGIFYIWLGMFPELVGTGYVSIPMAFISYDGAEKKTRQQFINNREQTLYLGSSLRSWVL